MKFWIGLAAGFAAGLTVGLLYAPARGVVTRRRIVETAGDLADTSRERMQDFTRAAKRKARNVSKMANEKVHLASDFAREKADDIGEAVGAVREKLHRVTA
ncbi:MAG TPA: YtxH domain-containing protein [Terracidiphilus sp.]|nr:YtxH domain-containing protein [Terracidiphilus sp.]